MEDYIIIELLTCDRRGHMHLVLPHHFTLSFAPSRRRIRTRCRWRSACSRLCSGLTQLFLYAGRLHRDGIYRWCFSPYAQSMVQYPDLSRDSLSWSWSYDNLPWIASSGWSECYLCRLSVIVSLPSLFSCNFRTASCPQALRASSWGQNNHICCIWCSDHWTLRRCRLFHWTIFP